MAQMKTCRGCIFYKSVSAGSGVCSLRHNLAVESYDTCPNWETKIAPKPKKDKLTPEQREVVEWFRKIGKDYRSIMDLVDIIDDLAQ